MCPGDLRLGLTRSQLAERSEPFFSSLATVGGGGGGGGLFAVVMAVGSGIEVSREMRSSLMDDLCLLCLVMPASEKTACTEKELILFTCEKWYRSSRASASVGRY